MHISYYDESNRDLKYTYWMGPGWSTNTIDATGLVGACSSIAIDSSNYPHISYFDDTNGDLKYAFQDSGGWHISSPATSNTVGLYSSLVLDSSRKAYISYYDLTNGDLKFAQSDGPVVPEFTPLPMVSFVACVVIIPLIYRKKPR